MKYLYLIVCFVVRMPSFAGDLAGEIDSIYDFSPKDISREEQEAEGPVLDAFWAKVKADTGKYLPMLREELESDSHEHYFYYDGSSLLLSLSGSPADKKLAIRSIAKTDIEDISPRVYVETLNRLAREGFDVTQPAIKILEKEKFSFFIPTHAMTFNKGYCLTYMLLPQAGSGYVDTLISIFRELSVSSQESVITTLWFAVSCKGDEFLKALAQDSEVDKIVSRYAGKIMGYTSVSPELQWFIDSVGKDKIADMRKSALARFSDESIGELDMTTRFLRKEGDCLK